MKTLGKNEKRGEVGEHRKERSKESEIERERGGGGRS